MDDIDINHNLGLNYLAGKIYEINRRNGWRVPRKEDWDNAEFVPSKLALIHSEVSEALEWFRQLDKEGHKLDDKIYSIEELHQKMGFSTRAETMKFITQAQLQVYSKDDIKREFGTDLVDIIVRTLSLAKGLGINMDELMKAKLEKNKQRGFRHGGKKV